MTLSRAAAIVGVDESDQIGIVPDKTPLQLHAEAARNALRDAAIASALCNAPLIPHGQTGHSDRRQRRFRGGPMFDASLPAAQFELPYGVGGAPRPNGLAG